MEARSARARPSPGRQQRSPGRQQAGRLPQPPHRREEFAASSKLANAGSKIAAQKPSASRVGSGEKEKRGPLLSAREAPTSGGSSPSESSRLEQVVSEAVEDPTIRLLQQSPRDEVQGGDANYKAAGEAHQVGALELARGGEALLRRLNDLNAANAELKRQLEVQVREVSTLQEAGLSQQQLLREFERQAEQARQVQTATIEARVRAEIGDREEALRTALAEVHEQARLDRDDLETRLQHMKGEIRHIEGERDEARERVREYEERLGLANSANAPEVAVQETRAKGLEMELSLLRARFARETEAKKAAERANAEGRAQQQELKVKLERESMQVRQLQKIVVEQTELANFRQEVCNDLQLRMKDQKSEAERKLRHEKGKIEAVTRLEGILPRHFLMQALA